MSIEQTIKLMGGELPNFDKETNIFYGVISQWDINPEVLNDIYINSRDLNYEEGVKEIQNTIDVFAEEKDLKGLFEYACDMFYYGKYKELYRDSKKYDMYKNDVQQIKDILRSFKAEEYDTIKEILEEEFNNHYEADNPDILYESEGYKIINCLDTDLEIIKSPYYCFAPRCSPCVPCAGNISDISEMIEYEKKTYCLDPSFYSDEDKPKYKIYEVATDKEIDLNE